MKESTALKIRKFLPKRFVKKVELVMLQVLEVAVNFDAGLVSEEVAYEKIMGVLTKAIQDGVMTQHNAQELLELAQTEQGKMTYIFLKDKYSK